MEYLPKYSKKYCMVEVDSWFYRIPTLHDDEYAAAVDPDFTFMVKAP